MLNVDASLLRAACRTLLKRNTLPGHWPPFCKADVKRCGNTENIQAVVLGYKSFRASLARTDVHNRAVPLPKCKRWICHKLKNLFNKDWQWTAFAVLVVFFNVPSFGIFGWNQKRSFCFTGTKFDDLTWQDHRHDICHKHHKQCLCKIVSTPGKFLIGKILFV